jgi:hypothetical protein
MVRWREPSVWILLAELAGVSTKAAGGAHVLALRRYLVARLETVTDPDATTGFGAGRRLARFPGTALYAGPGSDGAV